MSCGKPCQCESYRAHLLSISFSASATPTRRQQATEVNAREKRWNNDMPAYRRLRDDGLQPAHIDGAAELEAKASDPIEIERGRLFGKALPVVKDLAEAL